MKLFQNITLVKRMATIPLVFLIGAAALVWTFYNQLTSQGESQAAINLAGRQRMLNQRHAKETLRVSLGDQADYQKTRKLLLESIVFLRNGGEHTFGVLAAPTNSSTLTYVDDQEEQINRCVELSDKYLDAWSNDSDDVVAIRAEFLAQVAKTHKVAHATVQAIAADAKSNRENGTNKALLMSFFIVATSATWSFVVAKSATGSVGTAARKFLFLSKNSLSNVSKELFRAADETASQANLASDTAQKAITTTRALSDSVVQFKSSIDEIAQNASNAAMIANDAVQAADQTNAKISCLSQSSNEIGNVIEVINSIADQTNLLALNATIEAARAGEAGKGFAVVANEVKELAKETSKATEDIANRIDSIQTDTNDAVHAIEQVSKIIAQIDASQNAIAGAVDKQNTTTAEISSFIDNVVARNEMIAENINYVSEAACQTTSCSQQTKETAQELESMAEQLYRIVGDSQQTMTRVLNEA